MPSFLLHLCCAPCGAYVLEELKNRGFQVTAFFYNPNIYPEKEYEIRKNEIKKYCGENQVNFIEEKENYKLWLEKICRDVAMPHLEPEGGQRCELCYKIRLKKTAEFAQQNNFQYFDSTLSISPHKNFQKIKKIGDELAEKFQVKFYGENWKKSDGYKKSCEISNQHNFYRQNYCGCEFSINN